MERKIVQTADGSSTIFLPELNEHYHSVHGAVREAEHVYLKMGLENLKNNFQTNTFSILEMGFGTGLNALLSIFYAEEYKIQLNYTAVEAFPLNSEELQTLNYKNIFPSKDPERYLSALHQTEWDKEVKISSFFTLLKKQQKFEKVNLKKAFHLIYFDAFGPRVQPELWTQEIFAIMYSALKENGILVTYSAKGSVRRAMKEVGFSVERLPGPPGKREMLRAKKVIQDRIL